MEASWFKQGSTAAGGFVLEDPGKLDRLCKSRLIFALQRAKKSCDGSAMQDVKKPLYRGSTLVKSELDVTKLRGSPEGSPVAWGALPTRKVRANAGCSVCERVQEAKGLQEYCLNEEEAATEPEGVGQEQKCQKWGRHSSGTTSSLMKFVQSLGKDERVQLT